MKRRDFLGLAPKAVLAAAVPAGVIGAMLSASEPTEIRVEGNANTKAGSWLMSDGQGKTRWITMMPRQQGKSQMLQAMMLQKYLS